jgi:hypothetical protein
MRSRQGVHCGLLTARTDKTNEALVRPQRTDQRSIIRAPLSDQESLVRPPKKMDEMAD